MSALATTQAEVLALAQSVINANIPGISVKVAAIGSSGYVPVTSSVLPNPTNLNSAFAWVSKDTFTQTTGNAITTTDDLNLLSWNGTTWSFVFSIPVINGLVTERDVEYLTTTYGKQTIIPNGFWDTVISEWYPTGGTIFRIDENMRFSVTKAEGVSNTLTPIPAGEYTVEIRAKLLTRGDGKIGAGINGINFFADMIDDGEYHNYTFNFKVAQESPNFIVWNQNFGYVGTQVFDMKYVLVYLTQEGVSGQLSRLVPISSVDSTSPNPINSTALTEQLGNENVISNGTFSDGIVGWVQTGGTITVVEGNMRFSVASPQGIVNSRIIPIGSYTVEITAKLVSKTDGLVGIGLEGSQFLPMIEDGEFHTYKFDFKNLSQKTNFVVWSEDFLTPAGGSQIIDIKKVILYDNTQGLIGQINKNTEDIANLEIGGQGGLVYKLPADINHVQSYGQSLSMGAAAPSVSTQTVISNDMLTFATDPYLATGDLTPFFFPGGYPEVCYGGTAWALAELASKRGKSLANSQFLFSYSGQGGASILQLNKGTSSYTRFMTHVTNGMAKAAALGKTYALYAVEWTQGEADMISMTPEVYRGHLIQLRNDINADVKAITGQAHDIPFVMYQLSSFNTVGVASGNYNKDFVTLYEKMGLEDEGFYFGNPNYDKVYVVENNGADIVHLNAPSYKRMGAEYGLILDKLMTGKDYNRLTLLSSSFQGKLINLEFNKTVAIDTTAVASIANQGFSIQGNTIIGVELNDTRITITCANNVTAGTLLSYAFNATGNAGRTDGPRGNIRSTEVNQFSFGTVYDWLAHSKITL